MKRGFFQILLVLVVLLSSCSSDMPVMSIQGGDTRRVSASRFLSPEKATRRLQVAWVSLPKENPATRSEPDAPADSIFTIPGNEFVGTVGVNGEIWTASGDILSDENIATIDTVNTYGYAVTFKNAQGFVILSAKENLPDILFYTESGSYGEAANNPGCGFKSFMTHLDAWVDLRLSADEGDGGGQKSDTVTYGSWKKVEKIAYSGVCTKWGQGKPYYNDCPLIGGLHAKTGCAATALAQFMAFYQYPTQYKGYEFDWYRILYMGYNDDPTLTKLMVLLGSPENLNMNYGTVESSAPARNFQRTLSAFGYSNSGKWVKYNYAILKKEINAGRPIIFVGSNSIGGCHAWLCDKYMFRNRDVIYPDGKIQKETFKYAYCNWGWEGKYDGYAVAGVFDPYNNCYVDDDAIQDPYVGLDPDEFWTSYSDNVYMLIEVAI